MLHGLIFAAILVGFVFSLIFIYFTRLLVAIPIIKYKRPPSDLQPITDTVKSDDLPVSLCLTQTIQTLEKPRKWKEKKKSGVCFTQTSEWTVHKCSKTIRVPADFAASTFANPHLRSLWQPCVFDIEVERIDENTNLVRETFQYPWPFALRQKNSVHHACKSGNTYYVFWRTWSEDTTRRRRHIHDRIPLIAWIVKEVEAINCEISFLIATQENLNVQDMILNYFHAQNVETIVDTAKSFLYNTYGDVPKQRWSRALIPPPVTALMPEGYPSIPTSNPYRAQIIEKCVEFDHLLRSTDYKFVKEKNSVKIEKKEKQGSDMGIIRGFGMLDFTVKNIMDVLWGEEHKMKMESITESAETLETVNENCRVRYTIQKPPVVSRRYTCCVLNKLQLDNGDAVNLSFSINHPSCPDEGHVLSDVSMLGFYVKQITDTSCEVTCVGDIDPGGSIPGFLKRRLSIEIPLKIHVAREYLQKRS